jgi:hypothetical protein
VAAVSKVSQKNQTRVSYVKQLLLFLFITFHFYVIVLTPISQSPLGARSAFLLAPYVNFLGLGTQWSFYVEPASPPQFIEWELVGKKGEALERGRWPETPDPFLIRERQNRRIVLVQHIIESDGASEKFVASYLCRKNPQISSVRLWGISYDLPSEEEVASGRKALNDSSSPNRRWLSEGMCKEYRA